MRISDWSSDVCSSDRFAAARAVATVQDLAEGRFLFGVGTGWMREEFDAVGEALDGRGGRTDEMIEVMQELWTGAPVEHHGRHYDFPAVQLAPAPPEVPLVFGGTTLPALRRTARFGRGWLAPSRPLEERSEEHTSELQSLMRIS